MVATALYLASSSPRRNELLAQLGVQFSVIIPDVDETVLLHELPDAYVKRLAVAKAKEGLRLCWQRTCSNNNLIDTVVIGSDTSVVIDNAILGKPRTREEAVLMLNRLSGRTHQVMTSVAIVNEQKECVDVSVTTVTFKTLTLAQINAYCDTHEPMDKAGAYGIQGLGAIFVESIAGSYSGVVGLPLSETAELLKEFNVFILEERL